MCEFGEHFLQQRKKENEQRFKNVYDSCDSIPAG